MHRSYIFFLLDDGKIKHIPSAAYVSLVRGNAAMPEYAGKTIRVADLYAALEDDHPGRIENETYSFLRFDVSGHADPHDGVFSMEENKSFYDAALNSPYPDINCDPEVRKVREKIGDDFSWFPTDEERRSLIKWLFETPILP